MVKAAASTMATTRGSMLTKKGKVGGMLVRNTMLRCAAARFRKGKKREVFFYKIYPSQQLHEGGMDL